MLRKIVSLLFRAFYEKLTVTKHSVLKAVLHQRSPYSSGHVLMIRAIVGLITGGDCCVGITVWVDRLGKEVTGLEMFVVLTEQACSKRVD